MSEITVRHLGEDEWKDYRAVRLEALSESPEAFVATVDEEEAFDEAHWRARMQRSARLVAERDGAAVGVVSVGTAPSAEEGRSGELFGLWVKPELRGSGVATKLVKNGAALARRRGQSRLYYWVGTENGVQLQVWATWLVYACLVDLTDAVAEALERPFAQISVEMVYRGLYHYTQAYHRGEATDVVRYLANNARLLGLIKRDRKQKSPTPWEASLPADLLPGERPAGNANSPH